MQKNTGFTLIELMVVVVIILILALIAIPSYKAYILRADLSQAQQEMQKIAEQLERYKGRNFSYNGFLLASVFGTEASASINENLGQVYLPIGKTAETAKYILTLQDGELEQNKLLSTAKMLHAGEDGLAEQLGHRWKMKAISHDLSNYSLVMTSDGAQCKNLNQSLMKAYDCTQGDIW